MTFTMQAFIQRSFGFLPIFLLFVLGASGLGAADDFEGAVSGRVVARRGERPVSGATVTIRSAVTKEETPVTTDENGNFKIVGLRPGNYTLSVTADSFDPVRLTTLVSVQPGKTTTLRDAIKLDPERASSVVRGAVFDKRGYLVPNVKVTIQRLSGEKKTPVGKPEEAVTNSSGEFAFRLPGETALYQVTASLKGFRLSTKEVDVQKNEIRNIALTLEPAPVEEKP